MIKITRGLDIPLDGVPQQQIESGQRVETVALLGRDYVGMKPTMTVIEGERVKLGQPLFEDKKTPGVIFTSPGSGVVKQINRGEKRVFQSIVIALDESDADQVSFARYSPSDFSSTDRIKVVENLVNSGLWTALRTRPFSKVPAPSAIPHSIFVNAMDTDPLAVNPELIARESADDFINGLNLLSRLTPGKLFLCRAPGSFDGIEKQQIAANVSVETFAGPHPAGLSGTHIHFLDPVTLSKHVWSINYQDVIAVGKLFTTGHLSVERVIALAGPQVKRPRLIRTRIGADLQALTAGELKDGENRVISGSVLSGRTAVGVESFLGRYHQHITVLREGRERELFGYLSTGAQRHSALGIYVSSFLKGKKLPFTTTTNGSPRAMVPVGSYERVMPMDILPTQLLRSLIVGDIEVVQSLGGLELDEEDLALCTYVCPGKYEYGPILRDNLTRIEKEI